MNGENPWSAPRDDQDAVEPNNVIDAAQRFQERNPNLIISSAPEPLLPEQKTDQAALERATSPEHRRRAPLPQRRLRNIAAWATGLAMALAGGTAYIETHSKSDIDPVVLNSLERTPQDIQLPNIHPHQKVTSIHGIIEIDPKLVRVRTKPEVTINTRNSDVNTGMFYEKIFVENPVLVDDAISPDRDEADGPWIVFADANSREYYVSTSGMAGALTDATTGEVITLHDRDLNQSNARLMQVTVEQTTNLGLRATTQDGQNIIVGTAIPENIARPTS